MAEVYSRLKVIDLDYLDHKPFAKKRIRKGSPVLTNPISVVHVSTFSLILETAPNSGRLTVIAKAILDDDELLKNKSNIYDFDPIGFVFREIAPGKYLKGFDVDKTPCLLFELSTQDDRDAIIDRIALIL